MDWNVNAAAAQLQGCCWEAMGNPLPPVPVSSDSKAGAEETWGREQAVTSIALKLEQGRKGRLFWELLAAQGGSYSSVKM